MAQGERVGNLEWVVTGDFEGEAGSGFIGFRYC